jgi:hypothetical protein
MTANDLEPCQYVFEGDVIWRPFMFRDAAPPGSYLVPCRVLTAHGYHARVESNRYGINSLVDIRDAYVRRRKVTNA